MNGEHSHDHHVTCSSSCFTIGNTILNLSCRPLQDTFAFIVFNIVKKSREQS